MSLNVRPVSGVTVSVWRRETGAEGVLCSPESRAILGLAPHEPMPAFEDLAQFFEDWAGVQRLADGAEEIGATRSMETWVRRRDGSRRRVLIQLAFERDESGETFARFGAVVDITDIAEALSQTRERARVLTNLLEQAPAALAMFDRDLRYVHVSKRWQIEHGLEGQDLIGRHHFEVSPNLPQRLRDFHQLCLDRGQMLSGRDPIVYPDGRLRWLSWELQPWTNSQGEVCGLFLLTRDVTDIVASLEAAESSERRLRLALDASGDVVWRRDKRSGELFMSAGAERLLERMPANPATREQIWAQIHPEDRAAMQAAFAEAARKGHVLRHEHRLAREDGQERWALSVIEPLRDEDGALLGAIGILRDITEQRAEKRALDEARAAAEAASQAKTDFLATMSHEIRTPLNGVMGVAQALACTSLNAEQQSLVRLLLSAGQSLKALVDDTLEIGRIESGAARLSAAPFQLAETIIDAVSLYGPAAADKGLAFHVECSPNAHLVAQGDPLRVRQIVTNLVSNAVKFTDRGGVSVRLDVTALPASDGESRIEACIQVRDTGIGIDPAMATRIFDRFVQGDVATRATRGGAGLGLAIARRLAIAMGGDITLHSKPGGGSTFEFRCVFPVAADAVIDRNVEPSVFETQAHVKFEILVAEDHPINQRVLALLLEPFASRLTFVEDGLAACQAISREDFDLVLMDVQMPVLDGLSAIRLIRSNEAMAGDPRLPIICLTAQASADQVKAALEAGADAHVAKPIDKSALFKAIEGALDLCDPARSAA